MNERKKIAEPPADVDFECKVGEMREALKPFAAAYRIVCWTERATGRTFAAEAAFQSGLAWRDQAGASRTITYGDLRRAADVLSKITFDEPVEVFEAASSEALKPAPYRPPHGSNCGCWECVHTDWENGPWPDQ